MRSLNLSQTWYPAETIAVAIWEFIRWKSGPARGNVTCDVVSRRPDSLNTADLCVKVSRHATGGVDQKGPSSGRSSSGHVRRVITKYPPVCKLAVTDYNSESSQILVGVRQAWLVFHTILSTYTVSGQS